MPDSITPQRELVYLLHGIAAQPWMMSPLAKRLEQGGYDVHNWGYPSTRGSIEDHSGQLAAAMRESAADPSVRTVHVVAHSMGSIVTRHALSQFRPENLGRVVLLGPPNHGSPWATVFGPLLRPLCRPVDQLAGRVGSFVNELGPFDTVDFGVIAATRDLLVPLKSTHLAGQRDHREVACFHSMLLFREDVAQLVRNFLAHGTFSSLSPSAARCG
ncbi:MAG TPA: alpha/beta fold hydrolase [Pirellulaceae bacterium]|nr:alpha/beta fold hydrolase [Pirellulaceae bacterium]